jgi:integrase/recombinase XerD
LREVAPIVLEGLALTQLSNAGIPLRVIQEISGHNNLEQLQKYLEVKPEQVRGAVAALSMISHSGESCDGSYVGKLTYHDVTSTALPERSNNIHQQQNG